MNRVPLTGDTITDAQIEALRTSLWSTAPDPGMKRERMRWVCSHALGDPSYYPSGIPAARARCAEILNHQQET